MAGFHQYDDTAAPADCRIAIVASRFNDFIVGRLLDGCMRTLAGAGVPDANVAVVRVPGAFEIPVAAARLARAGHAHVVIALGAVIRGETAHFEFVAGECARGLAQVALETGMPVIFGVLTTDTEQQALERSGDDRSNKGSECALAALEMIGVMRGLRS
jgi:6,7-dimethyl-8-ribityllumazine synthase